MRKVFIAAIATLMCGSAFAQTTGPAPQTDTMSKPVMADPMNANAKMKKKKMKHGMSSAKSSAPMNDGQKSSMMTNKDMSGDWFGNKGKNDDWFGNKGSNNDWFGGMKNDKKM